MIAILRNPASYAAFAAATANSESVTMVRKKRPLVIPSRAIWVKLGDVDAVAIMSTPRSTVTEVSNGPVIPDEIGPTSEVAPSMSISFWAASTATEGWVCESRTS